MGLKSIYRSLEKLDEHLHRGYSEIADGWESKGHNLPSLLSLVGIPTAISYGAGAIGHDLFISGNPTLPLLTKLYVFSGALSLSNSKQRKIADSEARAVTKSTLLTKLITKAPRLPTFLAGATFLAKTGFDLANYVINGEPIDQMELIANTSKGFGFLGIASMMYLGDRDPIVPQKDEEKSSVFSRAYNWTTEKLSSLKPKKSLKPVTVRR